MAKVHESPFAGYQVDESVKRRISRIDNMGTVWDTGIYDGRLILYVGDSIGGYVKTQFMNIGAASGNLFRVHKM